MSGKSSGTVSRRLIGHFSHFCWNVPLIKKMLRRIQSVKNIQDPRQLGNLLDMLGFDVSLTSSHSCAFRAPSSLETDTAYAPFSRLAVLASAFLAAFHQANSSRSPETGTCNTIKYYGSLHNDVPTEVDLERLSTSADHHRMMDAISRIDARYYVDENLKFPLLSVFGSSQDVFSQVPMRQHHVNRLFFYNTPVQDALEGDFRKTRSNSSMPDIPAPDISGLEHLHGSLKYATQRLVEDLPAGSRVNNLVFSLQPRFIIPDGEARWHGDGFLRQGLVYFPNEPSTLDHPMKTIFRVRDKTASPSGPYSHFPMLPSPRIPHDSEQGKLVDTTEMIVPFHTLVTFADHHVDHSRPVSLRPDIRAIWESGVPYVERFFLFVGVWNNPLVDHDYYEAS